MNIIRDPINEFSDFISSLFFKKRPYIADAPPGGYDYYFDILAKEEILQVHINSSTKIRNYETVFSSKDNKEFCECGRELKIDHVKFSLIGTAQQVMLLPVRYCPKCDQIPPERATMSVIINGCLGMPTRLRIIDT